MTKLLIRLFVKESDKTSAQGRAQVGRLSGAVGIVCNALLFGAKILVGTLSGSLAITADAMNNLMDASSSVVTLVGFKLAERPADEDHPYGHARFEYLSGLTVAALILLVGVELAKSSLDKILHPAAVDMSAVTVGVLVGSIALKFWLSRFNTKLGKLIGSGTLEATAADSRNDCIATGAVLLSALLQMFTPWRLDGWFGMAVALFILYSGVGLARETISPLLGEAASPELRKLIAETVAAHPKVLGFHDLMVHDYGPGQRFGSLHVEMDSREEPLLCHDIIDDLERECLQKHNVHLVIHYDPIVTGDEILERRCTQVTQILLAYDSRLSIHDFRMVPGPGHTNLIFDVALPQDLLGKKKDILAWLEKGLEALGEGQFYPVVTFDMAPFNK